MEEYLKAIIEPLLSEPQGLVITKTQDDMGILLSVNLSQPDMGVVIGKAGETVKAIRTIIHMYGAKSREKISVKINEPHA